MSSATHDPHDPHDPHESDAMVGPHGPDDDGEGHGHDGHGQNADQALGPLNLAAWGAGTIGIVGGLVVAAVLAIGAGWFG